MCQNFHSEISESSTFSLWENCKKICVCYRKRERVHVLQSGEYHILILHRGLAALRQWCVFDNLWHCDESSPKNFVCVCVCVCLCVCVCINVWDSQCKVEHHECSSSSPISSNVFKRLTSLLYFCESLQVWSCHRPLWVIYLTRIWKKMKRASVKSVLIYFKAQQHNNPSTVP